MTIAKAKTEIRSAYRRSRRRLIVFIRNRIRLDEDDVRDQLLDGVRRDNEQLARALSNAVIALNRTADKLAFYELELPALKAARKAYDKKLRKIVQKRAQENVKAAAAARSIQEAVDRADAAGGGFVSITEDPRP